MKLSEMNENQRRVFQLVKEYTDEWIGGNENTMLDNPEDSEFYQNAKEALKSHEHICKGVEQWIRADRVWKQTENLHLVSLEWMRERIDRRVTKMGY